MATFGAIFCNVYVIRRHANGNEKERLKVPLAYGPAQKYLIKTQQDPDAGLNYAIKLPRMSFEITSVDYDGSRKLNTIRTNSMVIGGENTKVAVQYQGVPYTIKVNLSLLSKNIDDANQILEQILPWFTPSYTVTVNTIPGMEYKDDIPITLKSITLSDNYDSMYEIRRDVVWNLSFEIRTHFYGPIKDKKLITTVQTDILATSVMANVDNLSERNSIPRNIRITTTVDPHASPSDDYGYTDTVQYFDDGMRHDPVLGIDVPASYTVGVSSVTTKEKIGKAKLV